MTIAPLRYHQQVAEWLQRNEKEIWDWFAAQKLQDEQNDETRDLLLKETVRLSRETHGEAYECCETAMERLGVEVPVTLYQAGDGAMNAGLFFIPGEIHVVLYGPVLEKLSANELTALFGHEIAHYLLWTLDNRTYRIAQQIIDDSVLQAPTNYELSETARLYLLSTEVFADRGAVLAAGGASPAIAVLLKVMTGLSATDPQAFLEQAAQLDAKGDIAKTATHPESYLRAMFIDRWHRAKPGDPAAPIDDWVSEKLKGRMAIGALDIMDQEKLAEMTRRFFSGFLRDSDVTSEMVVTQIRHFFADWQPDEPGIELADIHGEQLDPSVRDYLIALVVDLACADPDQTDEVLARGAGLASGIAWEDAYRANLKSLMKLRKPQIDRIMKAGEKLADNMAQGTTA